MGGSSNRALLLRNGLLALAVVGAMTLATCFFREGRWEPRSIDDVLQTAGDLNLSVRSDSNTGLLGLRLIVAEAPLTFEKAGSIVLGRLQPPSLKSGVAIYLRPPADTSCLNTHPDHCAMWGKYLVYGDADLVKRLTSYRPRSSWCAF
jgi:hypothetical protein